MYTKSVRYHVANFKDKFFEQFSKMRYLVKDAQENEIYNQETLPSLPGLSWIIKNF